MKLIRGLLTTMAAGWMIFAADKAQASDVINGVLYAPLSLKAVGTYVINSHYVKLKLTNKLILEILGLPKNTKLLVDTETGDVWAFTSESSEDLTQDGYITISNLQGITKTGITSTEIDVYGYPQFNGGLDQAASESASYNWFEISGTCTLKQTAGAPNSKGLSKISYQFSTTDLTGQGFFAEVNNDIVPMTGGATAKGSGSLPEP